MTIAVFTFALLGAMALGMPIAFALIVCGVALINTIDMFDAQIVAQNVARAIAPDIIGRASEPESYQSMFALDARIADFC